MELRTDLRRGYLLDRAAAGAVLALSVMAGCSRPPSVAPLRMPELALETIDGVRHDLSPGSPPRAVVLAWTSAGCAMSKAYRPRLDALAKAFASRGVAFFRIDSSPQDAIEELGYAARDGSSVPLVHDVRGVLARRLGVARTTEVVVLDAARAVRYRGAVDDQYGFHRAGEGRVGSYRREAPARHYLRDALEAVLRGEPPSPAVTEAFGCALGLAPESTDGAAIASADGEPPITYHEHIEPIFQRHCQECHRPGGGAPFALLDWEDARGWAAMAAEVVATRRMPPWNADPRFGAFENARRLGDEEIEAIGRWFECGAPRGDPAAAPPPFPWEDGWRIGTPDVVYTVPACTVPAEGTLPYRYVTLETELHEDRWLRSAQVRSTAPELVHHVLVFLAPGPETGEGEGRPWTPPFNPFDLLQGAPREDYSRWIHRFRELIARDFVVGGGGGLNGFFVSSEVGAAPLEYPRGRGKLLPKGSKLIFQIHYTPDGVERESTTSLALRFWDEPPQEPIDTRAIATVVFEIPPGASDHRIEAVYRFPRSGRVLSLRPHMHLRGKAFRFIAELPDGREETLLHVPRYDFDWQFNYVLEEPRWLPEGTRLRAIGTFDNSAENPANPDPGRTVYFGLQSDEEMMIGYFEVVWDEPDAPGAAG